MKKVVSILLVLIMIFSLYGCGGEAQTQTETASILDSTEPVVWKLGHSAYEGDFIYKYAEIVKSEIESAFQGKVQVELYPSGQLGDYVAQQEQLISGGMEFNIPVTNSLGTIVPEAQITAINFILDKDININDKAMNEGKAFALLDEKLIEKGIRPLTWINEDFSCWSSNTPIRKVEDLKGLKIRVYPSSQIVANYNILGASPTPIPFAEVYSALQLNTATAQENPIVVIYSNKFFEVQKYVTVSNHTASVNALAASEQFWKTLSEQDQQLVQSALDKAYETATGIRADYTTDAIQKIEASGKTEFIELDQAERERMVEASVPAREEYLNIGGPDAQTVLDLWLEDIATLNK